MIGSKQITKFSLLKTQKIESQKREREKEKKIIPTSIFYFTNYGIQCQYLVSFIAGIYYKTNPQKNT